MLCDGAGPQVEIEEYIPSCSVLYYRYINSGFEWTISVIDCMKASIREEGSD